MSGHRDLCKTIPDISGQLRHPFALPPRTKPSKAPCDRGSETTAWTVGLDVAPQPHATDSEQTAKDPGGRTEYHGLLKLAILSGRGPVGLWGLGRSGAVPAFYH